MPARRASRAGRREPNAIMRVEGRYQVQPITYRDIDATVYPDAVPDGLVDELPDLYSSLFSSVDWWLTQDKVEPGGACLLEGPRHVLLFHIVDDTVEILNKTFAIDPASLVLVIAVVIRMAATKKPGRGAGFLICGRSWVELFRTRSYLF